MIYRFHFYSFKKYLVFKFKQYQVTNQGTAQNNDKFWFCQIESNFRVSEKERESEKETRKKKDKGRDQEREIKA